MPGGDLRRRLAVAGVGIPLATWAIYLGPWGVAALFVIVGGAGTLEFYRLVRVRGVRPFVGVGVLGSILLVVAAAWTGDPAGWSARALPLILAVAVAALVGAVFLRRPGDSPLMAVATTVLGVVYIGLTLSFGVLLSLFPWAAGGTGWEGKLAVFGVLFITWSGDSAAYFAGQRWGRRKLLPGVSPSKTVEGGLGGLVGSAIAAALLAAVPAEMSGAFNLGMAPAVALGVSIGVVAQIGDLVESLFKREAGVKDAGGVFPGHGGVLDRFDAVFLTLPFAYVVLPAFLP